MDEEEKRTNTDSIQVRQRCVHALRREPRAHRHTEHIDIDIDIDIDITRRGEIIGTSGVLGTS
jgi:hypothetical protein